MRACFNVNGGTPTILLYHPGQWYYMATIIFSSIIIGMLAWLEVVVAKTILH